MENGVLPGPGRPPCATGCGVGVAVLPADPPPPACWFEGDGLGLRDATGLLGLAVGLGRGVPVGRGELDGGEGVGGAVGFGVGRGVGFGVGLGVGDGGGALITTADGETRESVADLRPPPVPLVAEKENPHRPTGRCSVRVKLTPDVQLEPDERIG